MQKRSTKQKLMSALYTHSVRGPYAYVYQYKSFNYAHVLSLLCCLLFTRTSHWLIYHRKTANVREEQDSARATRRKNRKSVVILETRQRNRKSMQIHYFFAHNKIRLTQETNWFGVIQRDKAVKC